jgi:hypothetical protein
MWANDSRIVSAVSMTMLRLMRKGFRAHSGDMKWSSSDTWRVVIVLLYLALCLTEWLQSR